VGATSKVRLLILHVLVLSLLLSLGARLWYLQVMSGGAYARVAADNRQREVVVPAVRGEILDQVGRPLVDNRSALVVSVDPTTLEAQPDGGTAVLKRLAKTLGTS
jgi:penicillin-binding protein 2